VATRFYLQSTGSAPFDPSIADGGWERNHGSYAARNMSTTKQNTALTTVSGVFGATNTSQTRYHTFVSDTLNVAQTISGTFSIVIGKCAETTLSGDAFLAYTLRVVTGSGTHRATLASVMASTGAEFPVIANAATRLQGATSISSFAAAAGDRIVLEVGIHGVTPANETMQMRFGDPTGTADFAFSAALTTDLCPWGEISSTITFGTPTTNFDATGDLDSQSSTVSGSVTVQRTSTGGLAAQSADVDGTATRSNATTGGLAAQSATISGTATVNRAATGALAAGAATVAGSSTLSRAATGGLAAQAAAVSGDAEVGGEEAENFDATGDLDAQSATISGSVTVGRTSTGALAAGSATVAGAATVSRAATGALAAGSATISGTVTIQRTATGALASQRATVAGSVTNDAAPVQTPANSDILMPADDKAFEALARITELEADIDDLARFVGQVEADGDEFADVMDIDSDLSGREPRWTR
jgi:hypothetical protein